MFYLSIKGTCSAQIVIDRSDPGYRLLKAEITWNENLPSWIVLSQDGIELANGNSGDEPHFCEGITRTQKEEVTNFLNRELEQRLKEYKRIEELRVIWNEFHNFVSDHHYNVTCRPAGATICYYLTQEDINLNDRISNYIPITLILLDKANPIGIYRFPIDIVVNN